MSSETNGFLYGDCCLGVLTLTCPTQLNSLLVRKISALVVLPHEPAPLTGICQSVKAKNVKLLVVDRNLEKDIQDLTIAGDNVGFGKVAAQEIAKELKGKGKDT